MLLNIDTKVLATALNSDSCQIRKCFFYFPVEEKPGKDFYDPG